jgi:hypothetical protein
MVEGWHNEKLHNLYTSPGVIVIKSMGNMACTNGIGDKYVQNSGQKT